MAVRAVPTVAAVPIAEARVVEARTVAVAALVAEAVDVGDWSFWPLAVGYSKPEINRAGTRPAPTLNPYLITHNP